MRFLTNHYDPRLPARPPHDQHFRGMEETMSTPTCDLLGPKTGKPCTRSAGHSTDGEFHEARDLDVCGGLAAPLLESWRTAAEEKAARLSRMRRGGEKGEDEACWVCNGSGSLGYGGCDACGGTGRRPIDADPDAAEIAASPGRLPRRREVKEPITPCAFCGEPSVGFYEGHAPTPACARCGGAADLETCEEERARLNGLHAGGEIAAAYEAERLRAMPRWRCPSCGWEGTSAEMLQQDGFFCPSCGGDGSRPWHGNTPMEPVDPTTEKPREAAWKCEICGRPVPDFAPRYCCDGTDCGCNGMPVDPCVCSRRCGDAIFSGIGQSFEQRRVNAGIERYAADLTPGLNRAAHVIACISSAEALETAAAPFGERDQDLDAHFQPRAWQSGYRKAIADALAAIEAARSGLPAPTILEGREVMP